MDGFGGDVSFDTISDPIKPLLDHSDCEGELTPEECAGTAPLAICLAALLEPIRVIKDEPQGNAINLVGGGVNATDTK